MPNHVHLLLVPAHEDGLRAALAPAHRRYSWEINQREGWRGYLWQGRFASFPMDDAPASPLTAPQVRAMIAARWLRREYLGFEVTEAAWGLLLELYAVRLEGRRTNQTRLGAEAGVPVTTALQITRRFLATGILTRHADPKNKRAIALGLSDEAARRIGAYLAAASDLAPFVT